MGAVELTSKALIQVMLGDSIEGRAKSLERFAKGMSGTPNQIYMGAAASLFISSLESVAREQISKMMDREEKEGPRPWELLCFDPHEGMYLLARVGVIAYGGWLGKRAAQLLSEELRVADLIAAPDGNCVGLPGMRPPVGINSGRRALTHLWIEVRKRQGIDVPHRGTGGRIKDIKWDEDSDLLVEGPAWWMRQLLAKDPNLIDQLSRSSPLPEQLRLGLTISRTSIGTLATLDDPGPDKRKPFIITGSAASKRRADKREAPVTWISVKWNTNHRHEVIGGELWESNPPEHEGKIWRIDGI